MTYVHSVAAETDVVAVSVEYRLALKHKILACYDELWTVMKWVSYDDLWAIMKWVSQGSEPWMKCYADFSRVFFVRQKTACNSSGANIAHIIMMQASIDEDHKLEVGDKLNLVEMALTHPFSETMNQIEHDQEDFRRDRSWTYYEAFKKCGWKGEVEIKETQGEQHVFNLNNPTCDKAKILMKWLADFFQQAS
ncbi:probable carboxylesterase 12 [Solanum lycopersicum]|uniref:probable carboxylesterase 12 n=1 Tax=Solanum lycopersicum TaxID=4081 RepID=UPI003749BA24